MRLGLAMRAGLVACATLAIAMLGAVALMLKGLPGPSQQNVPLLLLFVPAHFAAAYGLWSSARRQ